MREDEPSKAKPRRSKKPAADRLARALRDNLKRRKAQVRAKAAEPASGAPKAPEKEPD